MVDTDGIPLGFEVYPGNTFEGHTVSDIVKKLKKKFAVRRFIFVGDRGLFSKDQLEEIKKEGEEYIVGMKLGLFKSREREFYNLDKYEEVAEGFKIHETSKRCMSPTPEPDGRASPPIFADFAVAPSA